MVVVVVVPRAGFEPGDLRSEKAACSLATPTGQKDTRRTRGGVCVVGMAGFEPAASGPPDRCASWLRHIPLSRATIPGGGRRSRNLRLRLAALCRLSYPGRGGPRLPPKLLGAGHGRIVA